MKPRVITSAVVTVLLAVSIAACSGGGDDDSPTEQARQQVCSDISGFKSSVNTLVEDVKKGNFGDAKDQLSKVQSELEDLTSSAKKLAKSTKSDVENQLDKVQTTLSGLTSASSLTDVQDTINEAGDQLSNAVNSITGVLSC